MTFKKFGKPAEDVLDFKQDFFNKDIELHEENVRLAKIYRIQPIRKLCKNCDTPLVDIFFEKHGINYFLCEECNHLNGGHEDTDEFVDQVYLDPVIDYAKYYRPSEKLHYIQRVKKIYNPKVEFLLESLERNNEEVEKLSYCDIGAGSGHLVFALSQEHKLANVIGYEVSSVQVQLANSMLGKEVVKQNKMEDLLGILESSNAEVISMIGVLEHLRNPNSILETINRNSKIKYIYLSLPMFSYSVFFEIANQEHFNRLLSGGHTHLYTQESIKWFCEKYDFELTDQWSFGADAIDLYRFMLASLKDLGCQQNALEYFSEKFTRIINPIQEAFDNNFCSETHLLLKKKK